MRDDNLALMRRGYEAFAKGDLDTIRDMTATDAIWYTPGVVFEPEYKGADAILGYLTALVTLTDGTFKTDPEVFLADDDRVLVIEHVTAARKGRTLDIRVIHAFDIKDGKVYCATEYLSEPTKAETFWS